MADAPASHLGEVLLARAEGRRQTGDFEGAREYYMRALARFGDDEGVPKVADIFMGLADVEWNLGEKQRSRLYLDRAVASFKKRNERARLGDALNRLGLLERESGDLEKALQTYEQALAIRADERDDSGRALTLMNLGALHRTRGDRARALDCYREAAELHERLESRAHLRTLVYQALRQLADAEGDDATLFAAFAKDRAAREAAGDTEGLAALCVAEGEALAARGHLVAAARVLAEAQRLRAQSEKDAAWFRAVTAHALVAAGAALQAADVGDRAAADQHAETSRACLAALDAVGAEDPPKDLAADLAIARLAAHAAVAPDAGGETVAEEANALATAAIKASETASSAERRGVALLLRARLRSAVGLADDAGGDLRRALDAFERTAADPYRPRGQTAAESTGGAEKAGSLGGNAPRTVAGRALGGLPSALLAYGRHLIATGNVRAGATYLERAVAATLGASEDDGAAPARRGPAPLPAVRALARLEHARASRHTGQHDRALSELRTALEELNAQIEREDETTARPLAALRDAVRSEVDEQEAFAQAPADETRARLAEVDRSAAELEGMGGEDLRRKIIGLRKVVEIGRAMAGELDMTRLLTLAVDCAIEVSGAERGFLISTDPEGKPSFRAARRFEGFDLEQPGFKISSTIAGEVLKSGEAIVVDDASAEARFETALSVAGMGLRAVAVLPLRLRNRVRGVLYLDHRQKKSLFSPPTVRLLEAIADYAAVAVDAATRHLVVRDESDMLIRRARSLEAEVATASAELVGLRNRLRQQQDALETKYNYDRIIGKSQKMRDVFKLLDRVVESDIPVVIYGESGTGKELVARAVHFNSARRDGPFVSENFAALSDSVLESELFGHVKGAFTGARDDRKGIFEMAHRGTLFIDEVGDISEKVQKELLRVLQEGEVRPVGADATVSVDVRIIAATNRDLAEGVQEGVFREDLYYRLNVIAIKLPALRERREDIPMLVESFLAEIADEAAVPGKRMSPEAMRVFVRHHWPGNVRELRNVVERAALLAKEEEIQPSDIEIEAVKGGPIDEDDVYFKPYAEAKEEFAGRYLRRLLERTQGNISSAARESGMLRQAFQRLMKRYDVRADDLR